MREPSALRAVQTAPSAKPKLFRTLREVLEAKTVVRWLLRGWIERGTITFLIGERSTYKSFLLLDRLMRLALDGHAVALISAEGRGADRRARAWLQKFAPEGNADAILERVHILERRLNLYCDRATQEQPFAPDLIAVRDELLSLRVRPVAIGLDTWSKLRGSMDDNSNTETAAFLGQLDTGLKTPLDAALVIVAHSGHTAAGRIRGASAIGADSDCDLVISRESESSPRITVERPRFKDSPELPPVSFEREVIGLGYTDDDGALVTSLVLNESETKPTRAKRPEPRGVNMRMALKVAREHPEGMERVRVIELTAEMLGENDRSIEAARRAVVRLIEDGYLFVIGDGRISTTRAVEVSSTDYLNA